MSSFSIYIRSVKKNVTEDYIKFVFLEANIGQVERVDFAAIGKKPGFIENVSAPFKSAFVHFSFFTNISLEDPDFGNKIREGNGYKFYLGEVEDEYWMLYPAKRYIQKTMMNNSQIVENCRYLENKIEEQEAQLAEQAETIQELQKKIDGIQGTVYQLLGGLFNQKSQNQVLQDHLSDLYSEPPRVISRFEDPEEDDSEWENWPTTRQGDANEEKIKCLNKKFNDLIVTVNDHAEKGTAMELRVFSLEEQIDEITDFEPTFTPYEEELQDTELLSRKFESKLQQFIPREEELFETDSVSTHSSMPGLVEASDSESDSESMPDLESVSSISTSSERLRNTFELCGNE
jgi:hypothetical protein